MKHYAKPSSMAVIIIHLHTILKISGNLTFIALTGTGIMSWNFYLLLKALFSALQEQAK